MRSEAECYKSTEVGDPLPLWREDIGAPAAGAAVLVALRYHPPMGAELEGLGAK